MRKKIGKKGMITIAVATALILVALVATVAFFTDRVDHSMQFTTAKFDADGYKLTRVAPEGPFCAGEDVTLTLKESNTGDGAINSVISMKATWTSPDTALSIFGNASASDNAKLSVDGTEISYTVSADKKSISFDLPKHVLAEGAKDQARELTLTIPASFKSTGRIDFTFEKVVVKQDPDGFSKEYGRTELNASTELDCGVKVGWAAAKVTGGVTTDKAIMGYLTGEPGNFGISYEMAMNYNSAAMKDFTSRTGAKWSYYKNNVTNLSFVEGMTTIGDYAFPDFGQVLSVTFPSTVKEIGTYAFDASGLTGTLSIPKTIKKIENLAFGHLPNVTTITFGHTSSDSLTLPDNTAAGKESTGAFYVSTHVDTTVNSGVEAIMYGYKWHDGYDNRRLVPTMAPSDGWRYTTYVVDPDYECADIYDSVTRVDEPLLTTVNFVNYYIPNGTEIDSWDVSDPSVPGTVTAYLSADKKTLTIAGNGYGLVFANQNSSYAFAHMEDVLNITHLELLDTRNVTDMSGMFFCCFELKSIDVHTWNVSKVQKTDRMFEAACTLTSIDLSKNICTAKDGTGSYEAWNPKALESSKYMFDGYRAGSALTTLNITGWNEASPSLVQRMFGYCTNLTSITGLDSLKMDDATDAAQMFASCNILENIPFSTWTPKSLTDTWGMFSNCEKITSVDISHWIMKNVTNTREMFGYCTNLESLVLPEDLSVIGARFATWCNKLTTITFNQPATLHISFPSAGRSNGGFFANHYTPTNPLGTKVITTNSDVMAYDWTTDCRGYTVTVEALTGGTLTATPNVAINGKTITLTDIADAGYKYDGATYKYSQGGVTKTITLDAATKAFVMPVVDDVTPSDVIVTPKWKECAIPMLKAQDTWQYNGMDTDGNPTTPIDYELLEAINIVDTYTPASGETSWDASANEIVDGVEYKGKVTAYLSTDKKTLTIAGNGYGTIYANPDSEWALTKAYDGMSALKKINGADILDTQLMINAGGMLSMNRNLESIDVSNWDTGKMQKTSAANGYYGMFMNCTKLKSLDVSGWDTKNVTEMCRMFCGCELLTTIDVSGWNTSSCEHMNDMFYDAGISQISVNGSGWDTRKLKYSYNMFKNCTNLTQIDLSTWDVSLLQDTSSMFMNSGLTSIDLSMWDESIVSDATSMFSGCKDLTNVKINGWNLSNLENSNDMFSNCTALTKLTIPAALKVFGTGFAKNCTNLTTIEFLHDADTELSFPTAGSNYGAFYVANNLPTNILGTNTDALTYDWAKDNRSTILEVAAQKETLTFTSPALSPSWDDNYQTNAEAVDVVDQSEEEVPAAEDTNKAEEKTPENANKEETPAEEVVKDPATSETANSTKENTGTEEKASAEENGSEEEKQPDSEQPGNNE